MAKQSIPYMACVKEEILMIQRPHRANIFPLPRLLPGQTGISSNKWVLLLKSFYTLKFDLIFLHSMSFGLNLQGRSMCLTVMPIKNDDKVRL